MMKHIPIITIENEGDEYEHSYRAGYCKETGGYILQKLRQTRIHYYEYYDITEDECRIIQENTQDIDKNKVDILDVAPDCLNNYMGADYIRGYDVNMLPKGCKPYIYMDCPFLYEDGMFYFHLYWEGRHFAALPRVFGKNIECEGGTKHEWPLHKLPGVKLCKIIFNGEEKSLCYGKEIEEFEGMEEWNEQYNANFK